MALIYKILFGKIKNYQDVTWANFQNILIKDVVGDKMVIHIIDKEVLLWLDMQFTVQVHWVQCLVHL